MATLTPEVIALLQQGGRLSAADLARLGLATDPGAYGGLVPTEQFSSYGWKTTGDNEGTPTTQYDRAGMEWAAQQLGVDPTNLSDADLYAAIQKVNTTPGQYTMTQDAPGGIYGDQTRAQQNYTIDASGNLVPVGNAQTLDLNQNSDWRSMGQPLAAYLAMIASMGAASSAGLGAGAAGGETAAAGSAGGAAGSGAGAAALSQPMGGSAAYGGLDYAAADAAAGSGAGAGGAGVAGGNGAADFYQFQAGAGETAAANPGMWQQLQAATGLSGDALMRLGTSLGLGAISAAGPNSQTTTQTSTLDPATAARQQASWDNVMAGMNRPVPTTSTAGMSQGLQDTYNAAAVQNQMIGQAQGLISQGTAGGTSVQNGLMGDVKSYLDKATTAGTATNNPYVGMDNPYTQRQIDFAAADLNRAYANNVAPKFASGSAFGNSGLGFAEVNARNDLLTQQAKLANDMRYKDLFAQQQLGESYAGRNDTLQNLIRQLQSSGAGLFGNLGESQAARADSMTNNNLNRFLSGATQLGNLSQMPVNTANTIFNQQVGLNAANDVNTQRAYEDWFKKAQTLQGATGTPMTNSSTTTPNGSAASRFAGGAIAGMQAYNSLTQPQKKTSNLWGL